MSVLKNSEDFKYDLRSNFDTEEKKKLKIYGCTKIGIPPSVIKAKSQPVKISENLTTYKLVKWETPEILIPKIPINSNI